MRLFTLLCLSLTFFCTRPLASQATVETPWREIGLRTTNLETFGLIYKRQTDRQDVYRRIRVAVADLSASFTNQNASSGNLFISLAMGQERRVAVGERLLFHHGLEPFVSLSSQTRGINGVSSSGVNFTVGLGYVLGVQLPVGQNVMLGVEIIPSASLSYAGNAGFRQFTLQAGFSSLRPAATAAYRF